ncbi:uncharacterized protein MYCFIDRAFT_84562 [Pseudocercospora fijiensis CIRAD86]|uniref:Sld7 C-terminal domain-containing protein n=1 Tax=Pseudocercospora fijiensis (strain CIRAD86) TaxID=383855 RepID=M3A5M5_PSEFD|nr:uncharacterized protein MYCFIDRAFT_84562 [Pseudocercospora fijiensis CIRAD86]EME86424.1 hypothetical protein MYCFIDRAFT_84562 [Pseudocercospora fijiensis CIRAD86]
MTSIWHGDVAIGDGKSIEVETSRIPLILAIGSPLEVVTSNDDSEKWLSSILLNEQADRSGASAPWWQSACAESPLSILLAIDSASAAQARATELLLYASRDSESALQSTSTHPTSPALRVYAQPLCSDLLQHGSAAEPTPPASPQPNDQEIRAVFLPLVRNFATHEGEVINLPPVRKRKTVNETFDEAAERRSKARRRGGEGVAAAAASRNPADVALRHRRSTSNSQSLPLQTRPLSRASSVGSSRVADLREPSVPAISKRSALGRVQSVDSAGGCTITEEEPTIEQKNKEFVSKIVMAGMRLYGLVQSRTRKSRANSAAASPAIDTNFEDLDAERQKDEEYKLVYHQVYKGTCFALRQHIATKSLAAHTEALRETVDKFLGIFCRDPLLIEGDGGGDEFTPGGRKAFGSSSVVAVSSAHKNPLLTTGSQSNTPCAVSSKKIR